MPLTTEVYRTAAGQQAVAEWCAARLDQWPVAHERQLIPTSAGETHLTTAGTGSDLVVLLPGTNANAATYLPAATALARRGPVVIADLPGQPGLSAASRPRRDRLQWYGRWLADVLEQIGDRQAVVLGHSLGGAIALACDSPRIAARVLVSTGGLTRLRVGPALLAATMSWLARPTPARSAALLGHFVAPGHTVPSTLVDWYTLVARHCRSTLAPPPLPAETLRRCGAVPCLVATGEHDVFLPPRRLRPAARRHLATALHVIPDAGHLVTDEHPHRITALLDEIPPRP
ncbi:alpha/beta fold hydrolase [Nonomuraea maritima]|uniref:alpha/beta fold hydrolase n=1 Tax=Nonomuraea maritima TaxID=683260 RepID=UPI003712C8A0